MASRDAGTVAYLTSGIFGYLYRFFPIGSELADRGYRVVIVTPSTEAAEHAEAAGFAVRHLARQEAELKSLPECDWTGRFRPLLRRLPGVSLGPRAAAVRHWQRRTAVLLDTTELAGAMRHLDPNLVLTEAEEHRDILAVMAMGYELMLFEDLYSLRPGPDVPFPARGHHVPTGSGRSRLRAAWSWQRFFVGEQIRERAEDWWVAGNDWHSMLRRMGVDAGLDRGRVGRRYFHYYDYFDVDRIRTTTPDLAFPGEPQPPIVTGPIIDVDRPVHDVDIDFEKRWAESQRRRERGARLVYVSVGTFLSGMERVTEQVIDAVKRIPNTEIIVAVGRDHERWRDTTLPANVAVFGRVPQMRVLADADAVVSTGGLNTGQESLFFGVPVLNLPGRGLDVAGNAARLTFHGAGRQLPPREISVESIRRELVLLLEDSRYRSRAAHLGESIRRCNGVEAAVAAIVARVGDG